ncbi:glycogen debranching enzyme GlgX [Magnetovibrio blakemorei]|uniref:Glycogen debranching enzyme GlgX n=1 Tax=Magnetovibrio blakemorei TaxID=28181 RepID=A0A1E5Q6I1_9PROT|nr:glycogen debranching enzyme GlgX [Magnetovibrio blakemorei]
MIIHPEKSALEQGLPFPMGATWDGAGANFALFSENAEKVELCLFDPTGQHEIARHVLPVRTDYVWHGYLPDVKPGLLYGYRVHGPYAPEQGHRFNANKLLVDPYARGLFGKLINHDAHYSYNRASLAEDLSFDDRDNAPYIPKCILTDPTLPSETEPPLHTSWSDTIIYELHVVGSTRLNPGVKEKLRGTFSGLTSDAFLNHLQDLGVRAVELLPTFPFTDETHLVDKGLTNYWGYSPYTFFAPEPRYLSGLKSKIDVTGGMGEFRAMVQRFHAVGIEVILDVVYNHTGEGGHLGTTLSLRGIDNANYYRLIHNNCRHYVNDTGCGNTLDISHPRVLQMVMDSLRYWVEYGLVDGFRFDLTCSLARIDGVFHTHSGFLAAIGQDPVLAHVKLIAEPWDLGIGGYHLGGFPRRWSEWNDRYRNTVREFWRGGENTMMELAHRITGSDDIFGSRGRHPRSSINFITAHDGFTLEDLVSYGHKHNEDNKENNRDGCSENYSWNCGVEGPTDVAAINELRQRQKRNFIATLFLSQGVPMLVSGDEMGRTQKGNNNAYCQDNAVSWTDWQNISDDGLLEFVKKMIRIRSGCTAFRRSEYFTGQEIDGGPIKDITWWSPAGHEMTHDDWYIPHAKCLGFHMACPYKGVRGERLMVMMNAHHDTVPFHLPPPAYGERWHILLNTISVTEDISSKIVKAGDVFTLEGHSLVMLSSSAMATDQQIVQG